MLVVPDVCRGHIWDEHKWAKVDPATQLLFTSCPSEKVCLKVCSASEAICLKTFWSQSYFNLLLLSAALKDKIWEKSLNN